MNESPDKSRPFATIGIAAAAIAFACGALGAFADSKTKSTPPPMTHWVVLKSGTGLWTEPGSSAPGETLTLEAQSEIIGIERATVGATRTPWVRVKVGDREGWIPEALLAPLAQKVSKNELETIGAEPIDRYHGIDPDYVPPDLVRIPDGYDPDMKYYLRAEAAAALGRMIHHARLDGLRLEVVSAYRAYPTQRRIYLRKLKNSGWDQRTVAKPGHSEHQLGTVVDLTGPDEKRLLRASFGEADEGIWLKENAPRYGFAVSYTRANSHETGYSAEPWHYRYWGTELAPTRHRTAIGEKPSP